MHVRIEEVMEGIMTEKYGDGDVFEVVGYKAILHISNIGICIMGPGVADGINIAHGVMSGELDLKYAGNFTVEQLREKYKYLELPTASENIPFL